MGLWGFLCEFGAVGRRPGGLVRMWVCVESQVVRDSGVVVWLAAVIAG